MQGRATLIAWMVLLEEHRRRQKMKLSLVKLAPRRLVSPFRSALDEISFAVHRNGEPEACGIAAASLKAMGAALSTLEDGCTRDLDKYQVETLLTEFLSSALDACGSTDDQNAPEGLSGYCDMGPDRTVIQSDHDSLIRVSAGSLPCRWFTREGLRISSLEQLADLAAKACDAPSMVCSDNDETCAAPDTLIHIYGVPAGRVFMFAPAFVGEEFVLNHIQDSEGKTITLKVLSLEPRVFDIDNFFSVSESTKLIQKALGETSETHKFHRSTTGTTGASVFSKRTSENAWEYARGDRKSRQTVSCKWVQPGLLTLAILQLNSLLNVHLPHYSRCLSLLGFDDYEEALTDGLQILRYNLTTAYTVSRAFLAAFVNSCI